MRARGLGLMIAVGGLGLGVAACKEAPPPQAGSGAPSEQASPQGSPEGAGAIDLASRIARFVPAELTADVSVLPDSERQALEKLIEASKLLDPIFDRQAWAGNPQLEQTLAADTSEAGRAKLTYLRIMRGPWDRQAHFEPFAINKPHPPGAGFYPEDLTAEEFKRWVAEHPEDKEAFESLFTLIRRQGDGLKALPYREVYAQWLEPAAAKLREAAALTQNASLKKFLTSRAEAFLTDDYYASDKDWMDLDSLVEITIGPYEVYEDELLGLKASYESFVTVSDPEASEKLAKYKELLPEMEQNLPVPDEAKTERGADSPIRVVDVVFTSGDARKSVQTIAFNLPNDERVRKEKGAKKVLLRNTIQTKFDQIMKPIGQRIITADQRQYLSGEAFFNETLFHELSHSLGPAFTTQDGKQVEVRLALGTAYSAIEEAKADVMGAYNILFMIQKGLFPESFRKELLASYFAGLFRSVRFGVAEAHGKGAALQINRFLNTGAATFNAAAGELSIDFDKLEQEITNLVRDLCMLQHNGERAGAEALLAELGVMSEPMKVVLTKVEDVPVDLRPYYPLAGETGPRG